MERAFPEKDIWKYSFTKALTIKYFYYLTAKTPALSF